MVIPRSRSRSILSRTCSCISRLVRSPVFSMIRSASVDLPWSIWAMIQKFRILLWSITAILYPLSFNLDVGVKRYFDPSDTELLRALHSRNSKNIRNPLIFLQKMASYSCFWRVPSSKILLQASLRRISDLLTLVSFKSDSYRICMCSQFFTFCKLHDIFVYRL